MARQELGELYWKITGDTKDIDSSLARTERGVSGLGGSAVNFGKLFKAAFASAAVIGVAKLTKALVLAASDAEETQNKFRVTFRAVSDEATEAAENLASGFGLSRTAAQGLLADTGDLLSGFGFTGAEALNLSTQVNELAVDLASFTNFSGGAEGASAALTKGLLGEREALKSLGIAISEADIQQLAEDKGIVGELDRQTKAQLTLELALRQSGNAIGDFARSQNSFANQSRVAQANIENLKVSLGTNLLPIANLGVTIFNDFAEKAMSVADSISDFVTSAEGADKIGTFIGNIAGSIAGLGEIAGPIFDSLLGAVKDIIQPFRDLQTQADQSGQRFAFLGTVAATLSGAISIIGTVVAGAITNLINFGQTIKAVGELGGAAWERLTGQITREEFRETIANVGNAFENFGTGLVETTADTFGAIGGFVSGFQESAQSAADNASIAFETTSTNIKETLVTAFTEAGDASTALGDATVDAMEESGEAIDENSQKIVNWQSLTEGGIQSLLGGFEDIGAALVEGELSWKSFAKIGLEAIASVLSALGAELAAYAALGLAGAFFTGGGSLIGVGPATLGSAAAFAAAGAVRAAAGNFQAGGIVPGVPSNSDNTLVAARSGEEFITEEDPRHSMNSGGQMIFTILLDGDKIAESTIDNYVNNGRYTIDARGLR